MQSAYANALKFANGELILAGNGGYIYRSSDGANWDLGTIKHTGAVPITALRDIAYNNSGKFVTVEDGIEDVTANLFYSVDDGASWTSKFPNEDCFPSGPPCLPFVPKKIFGVNGNFIALADGGFPWFSSDGITWQSQDSGTTYPGIAADLAYTYDKPATIVVIRHDVSGSNAWDTARSADGGLTWTGTMIPCKSVVCQNAFQNIAYAKDPSSTATCVEGIPCVKNGMFVVVGSDTTIYISANGEHWVPVTSLDNLGDTTINKVVYNTYLKRWISVADYATVFYSDDGFEWHQANIEGSANDSITDIAVNSDNGVTVAVANTDNYCMFYTVNGNDWTRVPFPSVKECHSPISIVWNPILKQFYAATQGDGPYVNIYNSIDGKSWNLVIQLKTGW